MTDYLIFRVMAIGCMIVFLSLVILSILIVRRVVKQIKASEPNRNRSVNELINLDKLEHANPNLAV